MSETAVAVPEALRGDRWGGAIPLHAAIDTRIGCTRALLVAARLQLRRPIAPGSARSRSLDSGHIQCTQRRSHVQCIVGMALTGLDGGQPTDHLSNG